LTSDLGVRGFARTGDAHQFLGLLFIASWLGLSLLLFGLSSHSHRGRLSTLGLLLMAAGLFHVQPPFLGQMAGIPVGRWSAAVLAGAGAGALMAILLSFPNRTLSRLERWLIGGVCVAVLLWNGSAQYRLPNQMPVSEGVLWGFALLAVGGSATFALLRSWGHPLARLPGLTWALAVAFFLTLWAGTLVEPALNIQGVVHPFAPLGVTVYLLPWLLPMGGMILVARKGLWSDE
jgi:hypothetical protein